MSPDGTRSLTEEIARHRPFRVSGDRYIADQDICEWCKKPVIEAYSGGAWRRGCLHRIELYRLRYERGEDPQLSVPTRSA